MFSPITSALLLVLLVNQARAAGECESLDFSRRPNQALAGHVFKTLPLDVQRCMTKCAQTVGCFSINTYQDGSGVPQCELLRSTAKASRRKLVSKPGYEYFELRGCKLSGCSHAEKEARTDGSYRLGSSVYKLHPTRKTWAAAKDHCVSLGGNLASVNSENENKFLQETMAYHMNFNALPAFGPWSSRLAYWKLDGEDSEASVSLHGGPFYERLNGMTTLHLPASGYATFPAVDISTTSFTFAIWVYHIYNGNTQVILADWSAPHKFMWRVYSGDNHAFNIRSSAGNEILPGGSFGPVPRSQWAHVSFSWNRDAAEAKYYVDGELKGTLSAKQGVGVDVMSNSHSEYDIGFKRDSNNLNFYGYLRDLQIFSKVLTDKEMVLVRDSFDATCGTWIGLNDVTSEGRFVWSDNSAVSHTEWTPGEPNDEFGRQDCVVMTKDGEWEDNRCDKEMPFICENAA